MVIMTLFFAPFDCRHVVIAEAPLPGSKLLVGLRDMN